MLIWILALRRYDQSNELKQGFKQLLSCLKPCALIVITLYGLSYLYPQDVNEPADNVIVDMTIQYLTVGGRILMTLILFISGIRAHMKATSLKLVQVGEDDILDDFS